ncbi:unnamed protein product, partial [Porites evermanni]
QELEILESRKNSTSAEKNTDVGLSARGTPLPKHEHLGSDFFGCDEGRRLPLEMGRLSFSSLSSSGDEASGKVPHRQEVKESGLRVGRVDHCEDKAPATPNAWAPVEPFSPGPCSPLWPEFSTFGAQ